MYAAVCAAIGKLFGKRGVFYNICGMQARENRLKIAEYKHKLASTDYVALKIAEGAATKEEYSEQIVQRAIWRTKINELEVDINSI